MCWLKLELQLASQVQINDNVQNVTDSFVDVSHRIEVAALIEKKKGFSISKN